MSGFRVVKDFPPGPSDLLISLLFLVVGPFLGFFAGPCMFIPFFVGTAAFIWMTGEIWIGKNRLAKILITMGDILFVGGLITGALYFF